MSSSLRWAQRNPRLFLPLAAALWWGLYQTLIPLSEALVTVLPVARDSNLGGALQFFFYDTPKVLLLTGVVFVMGMVNSTFTPERTRALLAGRRDSPARRDAHPGGGHRRPGGARRRRAGRGAGGKMACAVAVWQ